MGKYQKNIEAARRISVMQYLETYHPGELVRKTDKEYCTKTHSSLVITPANGLFHWFSQSKGGNNALDYLVKVEGMDFVSAVRLLSAMAPAPVSIQTAKASSPQQHTTRPFDVTHRRSKHRSCNGLSDAPRRQPESPALLCG